MQRKGAIKAWKEVRARIRFPAPSTGHQGPAALTKHQMVAHARRVLRVRYREQVVDPAPVLVGGARQFLLVAGIALADACFSCLAENSLPYRVGDFHGQLDTGIEQDISGPLQ